MVPPQILALLAQNYSVSLFKWQKRPLNTMYSEGVFRGATSYRKAITGHASISQKTVCDNGQNRYDLLNSIIHSQMCFNPHDYLLALPANSLKIMSAYSSAQRFLI